MRVVIRGRLAATMSRICCCITRVGLRRPIWYALGLRVVHGRDLWGQWESQQPNSIEEALRSPGVGPTAGDGDSAVG